MRKGPAVVSLEDSFVTAGGGRVWRFAGGCGGRTGFLRRGRFYSSLGRLCLGRARLSWVDWMRLANPS